MWATKMPQHHHHQQQQQQQQQQRNGQQPAKKARLDTSVKDLDGGTVVWAASEVPRSTSGTASMPRAPPPVPPPPPPRLPQWAVQVPVEAMGMVIGRKGVNINSLRAIPGIRSVGLTNCSQLNAPTSVLTATGTSEALPKPHIMDMAYT